MATWIKAGFWEKLCKPCKGYKGWLNLDEFVEKHSGGGHNYKVYTALLAQEGTDDPTAIILENTLDETPVWTRIGQGQYKLSAVNEIFKTNKTISFIGHNYDNPIGIWQFGRAENNGTETERVVWLNVLMSIDASPVDISEGGGGGFYNVYVEIRVYP